MQHGSLFNGIGGFQLAAKWIGWENKFSCEIDDFCNKVTKKHFPDCIQHGDITKTDFTIYRKRIDILTGGFPCQPFSIAGKRKGKEDDRFLWHEMLRAIKEIHPAWIVAENVYGIINQGRGLVFEQVCIEMENEGYKVQPYLLPACGKNAVHKRERFWFVANSGSQYFGKRGLIEINKGLESGIASCAIHTQHNSNSDKIGLQGWSQERENFRTKTFNDTHDWRFASEPTIRRGNHGIPNRVDRIKSLGNAIVPQVAFEIFKAIEKIYN